MKDRFVTLPAILIIGIASLTACTMQSTPSHRESPLTPQSSPLTTPDTADQPVNGKGLIAFHSNREGGYQIYVMESDGTDIRKLTDFPPPNSEPTWAPDGSRIAFTSGKDDISNFTLYTIAADGTNPRRLLEPVKGDNWYPTWSPQGDKIAFQSNRDGNFEIYIVEVKTGEVTRLTNNQATDSMPNWSPDGEKIVFVSDAKGDAEIHVMNADGTNRMRLTQSPGQDTQPAWSCDGNRIVFMSGRDGNGEIYVMNADGSDQTRLTSTEFQSEWSPQWAHNDEKILFSAPYDEGNWEIYMMDADGSNVIRLTEEKGDDRHATWLEIE